MKYVREHRDIKLVITERRINFLVSEPNYHSKKSLTETLLVIEMRTTQKLINKSVYLNLSVLDLSKIVLYEFWYDYVKPKYEEKVRLCYMDTDSFIVYIKTDDINKDIADDVETRFEISNYELERPQPKEKIKKLLD